MAAPRTPEVIVGFVKEDERVGAIVADDLSHKFHVGKLSAGSSSSSNESASVVECKVFIVVMSLSSVKSKRITDLVALAYLSHKFIIPVGRSNYLEISPHMNAALQLLLARINWIFITSEEGYASKLDDFMKDVGRALTDYKFKPEEPSDVSKPGYSFNRQLSVKRSDSRVGASPAPEDDTDSGGMGAKDFWLRHWDGEAEVPCSTFADAFCEDYSRDIETTFGQTGAELMMGLLRKDIFEGSAVVKRETYDMFCGKLEADEDGRGHHFFSCVYDYTVGYQAMRAVFNMESSVRLSAIQNLAKFQTPSVICSLADLTEDEDPNLRAVAALGLARAGKAPRRVQEALIKLLDDEDRLVRQSTCLAVAYMATTEAVGKLAELWRNDPFVQVREAARLALENIGCDDANRVLAVTSRLADEMRWLRSGKQ